MSNIIGILRQQLANLEQAADALEWAVYRELTALETVSEEKAEEYEPQILKKLHKLDEMQEEIDVVVSKLKELGSYYAPANSTGHTYKYKTPKVAQAEGAPKPRRATGPRNGVTSWQSFSSQLRGTKEFTSKDLMDAQDKTLNQARSQITYWTQKGYIRIVGKESRTFIYAPV